MKKDEVPQDEAKSFAGNRKLLYAVGEGGDYEGVTSAGWEAEDYATQAAVAEINRMRDEAFQRAKAGTVSPLEYHMYARRMEPATLSQTTGFPGWRIRRHLKPSIYAKLPDNVLQRYSDAMGLTLAELRTLPASPELETP